jgi:hypothetical protein
MNLSNIENSRGSKGYGTLFNELYLIMMGFDGGQQLLRTTFAPPFDKTT